MNNIMKTQLQRQYTKLINETGEDVSLIVETNVKCEGAFNSLGLYDKKGDIKYHLDNPDKTKCENGYIIARQTVDLKAVVQTAVGIDHTLLTDIGTIQDNQKIVYIPYNVDISKSTVILIDNKNHVIDDMTTKKVANTILFKILIVRQGDV